MKKNFICDGVFSLSFWICQPVSVKYLSTKLSGCFWRSFISECGLWLDTCDEVFNDIGQRLICAFFFFSVVKVLLPSPRSGGSFSGDKVVLVKRLYIDLRLTVAWLAKQLTAKKLCLTCVTLPKMWGQKDKKKRQVTRLSTVSVALLFWFQPISFDPISSRVEISKGQNLLPRIAKIFVMP